MDTKAPQARGRRDATGMMFGPIVNSAPAFVRNPTSQLRLESAAPQGEEPPTGSRPVSAEV
jgi:hypothetical protein